MRIFGIPSIAEHLVSSSTYCAVSCLLSQWWTCFSLISYSLWFKATSVDKYFFFSSRCSGKSFITCSAVCSPNQREHSSVCVGGVVWWGEVYPMLLCMCLLRWFYPALRRNIVLFPVRSRLWSVMNVNDKSFASPVMISYLRDSDPLTASISLCCSKYETSVSLARIVFHLWQVGVPFHIVAHHNEMVPSEARFCV